MKNGVDPAGIMSLTEHDLAAKNKDIFRHACGSTSSRVARLDMIPHGALMRLARRFELGAAKHGMDNYRQGLNEHEYVLERCAHILNHTYRLIGKLRGYIPQDGEDDAAAVMWGGAFLCESPLCTPTSPEIAKCRAEQKRAAGEALRHGPDAAGAKLGLADWMAEEILLTDRNKTEVT